MKNKLRFFFSWIVANVLIGSGYTRRIKNKAKKGEFILSVYFHDPDKKLFETCIKWLFKNNYSFLSQDDLLLISQQKQPFPKSGVVITLDDGWKSNQPNVVSVVNKYKIPVAIFLSTEPVENGCFWWSYIDKALNDKIIDNSVKSLKSVPNEVRMEILREVKEKVKLDREALTVDQVKAIAKSGLVTFGAHTVNHPILINCQNEEAYNEIARSKITIENWINKPVGSFAYPNGDYNGREISYLKTIGYQLAYTTRPDYLTQEALTEMYQLPRFCVFENISKAEAICRMLGVWQRFFNK